MNTEISNIMEAAVVPDTVPIKEVGAWKLRRAKLPSHRMVSDRESFTVLYQYVKPKNVDYSNLHLIRDDGTVLDIVMEDSPQELSKHIPIWLHGKGHVLKTGLGLGCVVRGLLTKKEVTHISVVEIDKDIIDLIGAEFKDNPRVTIYHADALEFDYTTLPKIDYAWHDIWCPENDGLQILHTKLMLKLADMETIQGAWAFPRYLKRLCRRQIEIIG